MGVNFFISYELVKYCYNKIAWRKYFDFEKISEGNRGKLVQLN